MIKWIILSSATVLTASLSILGADATAEKIRMLQEAYNSASNCLDINYKNLLGLLAQQEKLRDAIQTTADPEERSTVCDMLAQTNKDYIDRIDLHNENIELLKKIKSELVFRQNLVFLMDNHQEEEDSDDDN